VTIEKIRRGFKRYFDDFNLELPKEIEKKGTISERGWTITYVLTTEDGDKPALDFFAEHRMTNAQLVRIHADGRAEVLETLQETYGYNPEIEGDEERAAREFQAHNQRVAQILQDKGLL